MRTATAVEMMSASGEGAAPSPQPTSTGSSAAGGGGGAIKNDTSRPAPVKNPLLSMQVTGLTLDDFAHNALLLPAAPPPREPTPSPTPPMLEVSRESETTGRCVMEFGIFLFVVGIWN